MLYLLSSKFRRERLGVLLAKAHRDECGAVGLEKLLIIAAFVLPILGLLIWYRNDINTWVKGIWDKKKEEGSDISPE